MTTIPSAKPTWASWGVSGHDIPDGPDALGGGAHGASATTNPRVVDDHPGARGHQPLGAGSASHRHHDGVHRQLLAVAVGDDGPVSGRVRGVALELRSRLDVDTPLPERPGHRLHHVLVAPVQEGRQAPRRWSPWNPDRSACEANSHPMAPPPTTATDAGSSSRASTSSEVITSDAVDVEPGDRPRHGSGRQHDVGHRRSPARAVVARRPHPMVGEQGAAAAEHGDAPALQQTGQPLEETSTTSCLRAWLTEKSRAGEIGPGRRQVDPEAAGAGRRSGIPSPSPGTPWPGHSPGAGRSPRPCPARRWPPTGRLPLRRARWRTRPGRLR